MRQTNRYDIEFDLRPTTDGVWLDRGELERLIALAKNKTRAKVGAHETRRSGFDDGHFDDDGQRMGGKRRSRHLFDF